MSRLIVVLVCACVGCKDSVPAMSTCAKLEKEASVVSKCKASTPPAEVAYATDMAMFETTMGGGRVYVFKDDADYSRAASDLSHGGTSLETRKSKRNLSSKKFTERPIMRRARLACNRAGISDLI